MFVVTVNFTIRPDHATDFLPAMLENARASVEREPGCRQFDVCRDPEDPHEIFLYEIYDDAEAFQAHLAAEHFKTFDARVAPWVASKTVKTWVLDDGSSRG